jgi:hypothetical protein
MTETAELVIALMAGGNLAVGFAVWFRLGRIIEKQQHHDVRLMRLESANA